ncbi:hypothetical protein Tco_0547450 [Tanacetum coccineum]
MIVALRLKFNAFKAVEGEKEDPRSNNEFLADLNTEFHDRALLANQKRVKYKDLKDELALITQSIDVMSKNKNKKGLIDESFDWDEESLSSKDEGVTRVKAFMAIAEDDPAVGQTDARSGDNSPSETTHDVTSNTEFESDNQEPLPPLPKLSAESSVKIIKKKAQAKTPSAPDSKPKKKVDSSTEKLLLTLIKEVKGLKEQIKPSSDNSLCISQSRSSKSDDSPDSPAADNHLVHNEHNDFDLPETHVNKITKDHDTLINDVNTTINVEPSPTLISPSTEINHNTPVPQDKWSRDKHILMVNILGQPQASVTTRSRVRDSEAASAYECLYVNFLL